MRKIHQTLRIILLVIIMALAAMPTLNASAAVRSCRTDPIFMLSNGTTLNVTLNINADTANVRNVTYILHVPPGVTVTKVVYTAGGIGTKEMYKVYQDSPANTYTSDTVVTTQNTGSVAVGATMILNEIYTKSVTGYNGQHLLITLVKP